MAAKKTLADFPELVAQWHPEKNGDVTPERVTAGSHKKYWWRCPAGPDHEWQAALYSRVAGNGCPRCPGWTTKPKAKPRAVLKASNRFDLAAATRGLEKVAAGLPSILRESVRLAMTVSARMMDDLLDEGDERRAILMTEIRAMLDAAVKAPDKWSDVDNRILELLEERIGIIVSDRSEARRLSKWPTLQGDLGITGGLDTLTEVTHLEAVHGNLSMVQATALEVVSFDRLHTVGGEILVSSNPALRELHFPALRHVGKGVTLQKSRSLEHVTFPNLTSVGDGLRLARCPRLTGFDLPQLRELEGELTMALVALKRVRLSVLRSISDRLGFVALNDLEKLALPALESIGGTLTINKNAALTKIGLPALQKIGGVLTINKNPELVELDLPRLQTAGERVQMIGLEKLPKDQLRKLVDTLTSQGFEGEFDLDS